MNDIRVGDVVEDTSGKQYVCTGVDINAHTVDLVKGANFTWRDADAVTLIARPSKHVPVEAPAPRTLEQLFDELERAVRACETPWLSHEYTRGMLTMALGSLRHSLGTVLGSKWRTLEVANEEEGETS